jgi:PilZ domain
MRDPYAWSDARRSAPRVDTDAICWEDGLRAGVVVDLSPDGLKLERPAARPLSGAIQLELELPELDDVVWIGGQVCFDRRRAGVQSTGVRLVAAAARDLRRIRDFVLERQRRLRADAGYDLSFASCYARG